MLTKEDTRRRTAIILKGNLTMKCYKVKYLVKDELRRQLIIYAYSLKQAKILAEANPLDGVTTINVRETKSKNAIEMMRDYVIRYGGEAILIQREIDIINKMRIKCGKGPIDALRIMAMN